MPQYKALQHAKYLYNSFFSVWVQSRDMLDAYQSHFELIIHQVRKKGKENLIQYGVTNFMQK